MIARLTIMHFDPTRLEEVVQLWQREVIPAAREDEGFMGGYLLTNEGGHGLSITFWETEAAMKRTEETGKYHQVIGKFESFFRAKPSRMHYQVSLFYDH